MGRFRFLFMIALIIVLKLEKTADFSRRYHWFPHRLRNERTNSILMTHHYPDQGQVKQKKYIILNCNFLCLSCPSATFAHQHGGFVSREWLAARGLLWIFTVKD